MNANAEVKGTGGDTAKLVLAASLVMVGAVGFSYFGEQPLWVRLLGLLVVVAVAGFIAYQTHPGRSAVAFFAETRTEVRKVVWPTRQETLQTSLAIFLGVLVMALILWAVDSLLFAVVRYLTGQ